MSGSAEGGPQCTNANSKRTLEGGRPLIASSGKGQTTISSIVRLIKLPSLPDWKQIQGFAQAISAARHGYPASGSPAGWDSDGSFPHVKPRSRWVVEGHDGASLHQIAASTDSSDSIFRINIRIIAILSPWRLTNPTMRIALLVSRVGWRWFCEIVAGSDLVSSQPCGMMPPDSRHNLHQSAESPVSRASSHFLKTSPSLRYTDPWTFLAVAKYIGQEAYTMNVL